MKTTKLFALASVLLITFLAFSYSPANSAVQVKKSVYISLEQAMENPGLVEEMYIQLNEDFLQRNQVYYTQYVVYANTLVYITGSYSGWHKFFKQRVAFWSIERDL